MKKEERMPYIRGMMAGFGAISLSVLFFFVIFRLGSIMEGVRNVAVILRPIIIGAVLAYLLRIPANRIERLLDRAFFSRTKWLKKTANGISVFACTAALILLIYFLAILILPQLYSSIMSLRRTLPGQVEALMGQLEEQFVDDAQTLSLIEQAKTTIMQYTDDWVQKILLPNIRLLMNGVTTGVIVVKDLLIGLIAMVYLLAVRHTLARQAKMILQAVFRPTWTKRILTETAFADQRFGGFINGKLIDSFLIGVLCYFFSLLFRFPSALLISVIIGVTNVIPFFGPFIGAVPATLLILIQEPVQALWFILFILILQQIDGNIIGPRILGASTGLSSFWVLFSILLFGGLFGFIGMIIAVPTFAVIYDVVKQLVHVGMRRNGVLTEKEEPTETEKPAMKHAAVRRGKNQKEGKKV